MRYMDEVAKDLKIQDLVDEKGLSRQCLFQLRDKQTGLYNILRGKSSRKKKKRKIHTCTESFA